MKKCPECGNPSYDGAPVCGNCGHKFPKPKSKAPRSEDIFLQEPKVEKASNDEDTITIIKENKILIGTILIITLIVICGIVFVGYYNDSSSSLKSSELTKYSANGFSFDYPNSWKEINKTDSNHIGAKFYKNSENVTIEFYNITSISSSLKGVTQDILYDAQDNGAYIDTVEKTTINGLKSSNIILENANGSYTRYVSLLNNNQLYVFKFSGKNANLLTSDDINTTLNSISIS